MFTKSLSAATAVAVLFGSLGESLAGGHAVECYAPYREAPVYDTVQERVLFRAGKFGRRSRHLWNPQGAGD